MTDKTDALTKLHTRLVDSVDGYTQAIDQMTGEHAGFVTRVLDDRKGFHDTVHSGLVAHGIQIDAEGSTAAALHRQVFKIRDAVSSGDTGIIAECARGDGHLEAAYDEAIKATEGDPDWAFLTTHRAKIAATRKQADALT